LIFSREGEEKMGNRVEERIERRIVIIDGYNSGLTNENIATKLGVTPREVRRDVNRMQHQRDPELKLALKKAHEKGLAKKQSIANRPGERFQSDTGMTFQEKTFNNMMTFYDTEIKKILRSKIESDAIRELPSSVRKTLKRNGIIAQGWKTPEITNKAKSYLAGSRPNSLGLST
jgi:DNA-binding Lrp family transcriptional regulator